MKKPIWLKLKSEIKSKGALFLVLFDPDSLDINSIPDYVNEAQSSGVDVFLVGGSLVLSNDFQTKIKLIKKYSKIPVIIFPGSAMQLSPSADAILFMSLISGRNPQWLISEQVNASPLVKKMKLETIPTGYILIDSGTQTSVSFMSNTIPLPADKPSILCAHGLAGQYLGMQLLYLDAGSGAKNPIKPEMVKALCEYVNLPIFVGGGIKTPEYAEKLVKAGASGIVIGNFFEKNWDKKVLIEFSKKIHNNY